jgi:pimeloyl-ACP methyl ester carboxylesterase
MHALNAANSRLQLEVLSYEPRATSSRPPLLFVHGAFTAAWCWAEHFLPFFAAQGYRAHALSLRGHGMSEGRSQLDWHSIGDYVDDVAQVIAGFDAVPVLVGHSMGGLVVQKYLERAAVPAAVLMASVPPQGLLSASLTFAMQTPDLLRDINAVFHGGRASADSLRQVLFAQPIGIDALQRYQRLLQAESQRAIWDMALFNLPHRWRMQLPPLLVLGAELDSLIPARFAEATANYYGTPFEIFPGMGHGMMLEAGWESVAQRIVAWLGATLGHAEPLRLGP